MIFKICLVLLLSSSSLASTEKELTETETLDGHTREIKAIMILKLTGPPDVPAYPNYGYGYQGPSFYEPPYRQVYQPYGGLYGPGFGGYGPPPGIRFGPPPGTVFGPPPGVFGPPPGVFGPPPGKVFGLPPGIVFGPPPGTVFGPPPGVFGPPPGKTFGPPPGKTFGPPPGKVFGPYGRYPFWNNPGFGGYNPGVVEDPTGL